ncbi:hypothetical protein BXY66_1571 [Shimia isoporae]|uniref:Uncharacterized protein n=1 Tax=Shimia isoporae TaxID=647720 RepID=A0A4R1NNW0_9RHOB|nr:hypothetical protein [Shimia isoporae]TCL09521.1 hypothetical protein BXY66_1571 [Shimia isoporae]
MFRPISLALCLVASNASASDVGSDGKYFVYNGTKFLTKGAQAVAAPGQTGRITGKGLLGFFTKNGFAHYAYTSAGGTRPATEFEIDGSLLASGNVNVSLAAGDVAEVGVEAEASIDTNKSYKGLFVEVKDWPAVINELNDFAATQPDGSAIFNKDFRVISSVLYVTGYTDSMDIEFDGSVNLEVEPTDEISVVGTVTGEGSRSSSFSLSDGSTVAFSLRHVCWNNKKIVDIVADVVGQSRPGDCDKY